MVLAILIGLLVILMVNGLSIVGLPELEVTVATINGNAISLWDLIAFVLIASLIGILPRPFREIFAVVLALWTLSVLGVLAIGGLSTILLLAILVGTAIYLFTDFGNDRRRLHHHHDRTYVDESL